MRYFTYFFAKMNSQHRISSLQHFFHEHPLKINTRTSVKPNLQQNKREKARLMAPFWKLNLFIYLLRTCHVFIAAANSNFLGIRLTKPKKTSKKDSNKHACALRIFNQISRSLKLRFFYKYLSFTHRHTTHSSCLKQYEHLKILSEHLFDIFFSPGFFYATIICILCFNDLRIVR